jgi:ATP-dependent exoDNAse (exonuclease V) alpha subunit
VKSGEYHYILLQRNLLYTGITRAKRLVVLVGSCRAIGMAVHNNRVDQRWSGLARRLQGRPRHRAVQVALADLVNQSAR